MSSSTNPNLTHQLKNELQFRYSLVPTEGWLNNFIATTSSRTVPLASLASTAQFRLLSTDFTSSLSNTASHLLPSNITDVQIKEARLSSDIPVQILDIRDIGSSKWAQIETIERVARGEEIRGREVIRTVSGVIDDEDNTNENQNLTNTNHSSTRNTGMSTVTAGSSKKGSSGPHKILVQDAAGTKVWAFELKKIEKITIVNSNPPLPGAQGIPNPGQPEGMQIGCKILLKRGILIRRGLVMLAPENVIVMGGRVEIWDKRWREGRKAQLAQELAQENAGEE